MRRISAFFILAAALAAQTPVTGDLLIATPKSSDPDFARSVVLLLYADRDAAVGIMLNRKGSGGPVPAGRNTLVRAETAPANARRILPGVAVLPPSAPLPDFYRTYTGTCGWTMVQLRREIRDRLWRVQRGTAAIVFDPAPGTLWERLR